MNSYENLGLDASFRKVGSLAASDRGFSDAYSWDATTDVSLISEKKIRQITADVISAGTITVALNLGGANLTIDGANQRITMNDGTVDRLYLGKVA